MSFVINRVYTRSGDKGMSSLVSGERVPKNHPRMEAYGKLDHLVSILGWYRARFKLKPGEKKFILGIQNYLYNIGARMGSTKDIPSLPPLDKKDIRDMELVIDKYTALVPPLKSFVLPGTREEEAFLHVLRTETRNIERWLVGQKTLKIPPLVLAYLNRLSDLFYILSRAKSGGGSYLWTKSTQAPSKTSVKPRKNSRRKSKER